MNALSRKNALFAGSDEGAEQWAMLASLIESCKLHGVKLKQPTSTEGWPAPFGSCPYAQTKRAARRQNSSHLA